MNRLKNCTLCPRSCGVDRTSGKTGFCGATDKVKVARIALHFWEEPCISGENGSGTVFFSHCTMKCVFCQNYNISTCHKGREITIDELAEAFVSLQNKGANNINLVTPTHYVPQIIASLEIARKNGLTIPIVYNTSGYESVETIRSLDGYVDIYMPDMKYFADKYAVKYSNAPKYFETTARAIEEMYRQVGKIELDENGIMKKGLIVRHLMLPGLLLDSKRVMDYLFKSYGNDIYISLMCQYTPLPHVKKYPELDRKIDMQKYEILVDYCSSQGMENVFVQNEESAQESFIPDFDIL